MKVEMFRVKVDCVCVRMREVMYVYMINFEVSFEMEDVFLQLLFFPFLARFSFQKVLIRIVAANCFH